MPEGDTIARLAASLDDRAVGRNVQSMVVRHPRLATLDLTGETLVRTSSHGKHLFLHFSDGTALHIHLLMQGRVMFGRAWDTEEWRRRFEIRFDDGTEVIGIDIPLLHHIDSDATGEFTSHLGPDLCGQLDLDLAHDRVLSAGDMHLSAALLDQRHLAGFGNIYAVEVPFICGISPYAPVDEIVGLDTLLAIGAALIRTNALRGPQNTTGRKLHLGDTWMLDTKRRDCPLCGSDIEKRPGKATPWRRRTAWCTQCQADANRCVDVERATKLLGMHPARHLLALGETTSFVGDNAPLEI